MLGWAVTFFIIAIIAAVFGFGGIAGAASGIAQFLFFVFVALLVISLIANARAVNHLEYNLIGTRRKDDEIL